MKKSRGRACVALGSLLLTTPAWADVGAEMEAEGDVGAEMSAEGEAKAEGDGEAKAGGETAAAGPKAAAPAVAGEEFASPSGQTGAGLSLSPAQKGRVWLDLGFHTQSNFFVFSPMLGGGYKVADSIELELVVPMVYASFSQGFIDDSSFNMGNIYAGVNVLGASGELKYKVGGGFGFPSSSASDIGDLLAYSGGLGIHALQEYYLWAPESLSMNGIGRVEYGTKVLFTGDLSLSFYFPIGDAAGSDNELTFTIAPGVAAWLGDSALLGGRVLVWYGSFGGDNAQIAVEPYFRYKLGDSAFLNTRFTLNIDEPAGFGFDDGGFWGFFLGGGFTF